MNILLNDESFFSFVCFFRIFWFESRDFKTFC